LASFSQKIYAGQFPEKHRRFDCPCRRQKAHRLSQKLQLTPTKLLIKPAQAFAEPGEHDPLGRGDLDWVLMG
jgi:hypothetical protein